MDIPAINKIFEINLQTHFDFPNTVMKGKKELKCEEKKEVQTSSETTLIMTFKDKKTVYNINEELQKKYDGTVEEVTKKTEYIDCEKPVEVETSKKLPKPHKFPYTRTDTVTSFPNVLKVVMNIFDNKLKKTFLQSEVPNRWNYGDHTYALQGIIVHSGAAIDSGHYMYFSFEDGKWFEYSDDSVKAYKDQKEKKSYYKLNTQSDGSNIFYTNKNVPCPYILYYQKVNK
jgi:Ubiquitin carboxyl-terminal hydrolase